MTFLQFSSLMFDNVIVKTLFFCSWLPNVHPRVCSFDCILLTAFLVNVFENENKNIIVFSVVMVTLLCHPFFSFFNKKKNNSMLACRIVCCSHQSDCHIWVCILQQSDCHIQVCILQQSDCHIWVFILQQSDCYIRVCILQQSDCHIQVCILQQPDCHIRVCILQ